MFDTVDSIYNQIHILLQVLTKQAVPFTKLVASSPSVLIESARYMEEHFLQMPDPPADADDADEDEKVSAKVADSPPDPPEAKSPSRKLKAGEKAYHLHKRLQESELFLAFLHEFGKRYRTVSKFTQHTKEPIAHLLYYELLAFQQTLFNLCLQFKPREADEEVKEVNLLLPTYTLLLIVKEDNAREKEIEQKFHDHEIKDSDESTNLQETIYISD